MVRRTENPTLRAEFQAMRDCPVRDRRGNCRSFTEYIVSALVRSGAPDTYDMEAALAYVVEKMLLDRTESGEAKATLFSGFEERPDYVKGNPLQARFLKYLQFAVNNIRKGNVPRLRNVEQRPAGTVSIGRGRRHEGGPGGEVAPDAIAAKRSTEADLGEMVGDLTALLRRKEQAYPLPLVALFQAIMTGERTEEQRRRFGDRAARIGRQVIVQTVHDYAHATGNLQLLNLLHRLQGSDSATPARIRTVSTATAAPLSEKQRDYASIASVIDRLGRPVGSADLGKYRRRWLDYPPRDAASGHRNRLEEVLEQMVRDGVLQRTRTAKGAVLYAPGANYERYGGGVQLPSFREYVARQDEGRWLPSRGAFPVQARINPFPTTRAHLERMRAKPVSPPKPIELPVPKLSQATLRLLTPALTPSTALLPNAVSPWSEAGSGRFRSKPVGGLRIR